MKNKFYEKVLKKQYLILFFYCLVFSISYTQFPLYYGNQNTYFIHGLADANHEALKEDLLYKSPDPFPVFSQLVKLVSTVNSGLFYFFHFILSATYLTSLIGIIRYLFNFKFNDISYHLSIILIIIVHSHLLARVSSRLFNYNLKNIFTVGFAEQEVLGHVFQPSAFGVLFILAIFLLIKRYNFLALLLIIITPLFHSTYFLSAIILSLIILLKLKSARHFLFFLIFSAILWSPYIFYILYNFSPTTLDSMKIASDILVHKRVPHHADIRYWFDFDSLVRTFIILAGILVVRKKQDLFQILLISSSVCFFFMIIQYFIQNNQLALLFPWRLSVWILPITSVIFLTWIFHQLYELLWHYKYLQKTILYVFLITVFISLLWGSKSILKNYKIRRDLEDMSLFSYIAASKPESPHFLINTTFENFRLTTFVPVYVDRKSHPYKDKDIIEWYKRLQLAELIYNSKFDSTALELLTRLCDEQNITHCLFSGNVELTNAEQFELIHQDSIYKIYTYQRKNR
ncbi:hypothetical protein GF406_21825 [candidate division KSB1 bacterium]|nr:hypothetical protein [candidate division KSB1 bacterium]